MFCLTKSESAIRFLRDGTKHEKKKPLHSHTKLYELEDIFVVLDSFCMAFQIYLSIVILVSFFVSGFLPQLCSTVCTTEELIVPVNAGVQIHALHVNATAVLIDALPTVVVR